MAAGEMPPANGTNGLSGSLLPVSAKAFDQMPDDTALQLPAMGGIADAGQQSVCKAALIRLPSCSASLEAL